MDEPSLENPFIKTLRTNKVHVVFLFVFVFLGLLYWVFFSAPSDFPSRSIQNVRSGTGLDKVSTHLAEVRVVRSATGFRMAAIMLGGERGMQAGDYYFSKPANAFEVAKRIVKGERQLTSVRLTIPEGFTAREIADLFDDRFPKFDRDTFLEEAREGYLFPDTYFVEISATASSTINLLENNFYKKIEPLREAIEQSGKSEKEILTMASILESEGKTKEDREVISGILWKRISRGMPLQVDATLTYLTGKTSAELTQDDLKLPSPYNTYVHKGLPPGPISNPGLESIEAALNPTASPYLYFLNDTEGTMHYAKTFEEHKQNKLKYITE